MPIYEYGCAACGQVVEQWQKISDPPLTACPACNGELHKLMSCSTFHLKGSGWYISDYGRKIQSANQAGTSKSEGGDADAKVSAGNGAPSVPAVPAGPPSSPTPAAASSSE
jgi:putative FmdB family regulatory protein